MRPRPAFIVGAARSGTTLLRLALDAHPDIGCPGESGLPSLIFQLGQVWYTVATDIAGEHVAKPPVDVQRKIRRAASEPMAFYCAPQNKRVFCDKSLDAPDNLAAIHQVFPRARYVLLFRHPLDVVASGLEASPYGFRAFGYAPFVQHSVDNFVAALVRHWTGRARQSLEWESMHPRLCHRVRYEDLVHAPHDVMAGVFEFLKVDAHVSTIDAALAHAPHVLTPGDSKIAFAREVHTSSVGRGRTIPIELLSPALRAEMNEVLGMLDYPEVTDQWNVERAPGQDTTRGASADVARQLSQLMPATITLRKGDRRNVRVKVLAEDLEAAEWVVDMATGRVAAEPSQGVHATLIGRGEDLVAALRARENAATLITRGRIRYRAVGDAESQGSDERGMRNPAQTLLRALQDASSRYQQLDSALPSFTRVT